MTAGAGHRPGALGGTTGERRIESSPVPVVGCLVASMLLASACRGGTASAPASAETLEPTPIPADGGKGTDPDQDPPRPRPNRGELAPREPPAQPKLELLDVVGFDPAVVSVPSAEGRGMPLLVAVHGAGDRPEWHCGIWQEVVANRGFVLCPRGRRIHAGVPHDRARYYLPDHHWLRRLTGAAVEALRLAYGERVDEGGAILAGYSQGATMGALIAAPTPALFSRAVLIEGGSTAWTVATARSFREAGGQRIAFLCGVAHCRDAARRAERWLTAAGVPTRVEYVPEGGHTYDGSVGLRLPELFSWVTAEDPRWQPL